MEKYDIAIIGGGIIGTSIAYFLAQAGTGGDIVIIEADSSYEHAATPAGAGGCRQLFSLPENIAMSRYSLNFYKNFATTMGVDGEPADIDFNQCGYLFVVGERGARQLEANYEVQISAGVEAKLLDQRSLATLFPDLVVDDVALGCLSPTDATFTTRKILTYWRRKVESMGVQYKDGRVVALNQSNGLLRDATLADGRTIEAEMFVNATGAWAGELSAMAGMPLPVEPMCRVKHYWELPTKATTMPLVKDESGLFFRRQGNGFVGGRPSWAIPAGFIFRENHNQLNTYFESYFEREVHPLLNNRLQGAIHAFESERWFGHYAQNTLDGNMILGPWSNGASNFYVAAGFSGHGIMHAPAVGLSLAEIILTGQLQTLDLDRFSYQRVVKNAPYPELGII